MDANECRVPKAFATTGRLIIDRWLLVDIVKICGYIFTIYHVWGCDLIDCVLNE